MSGWVGWSALIFACGDEGLRREHVALPADPAAETLVLGLRTRDGLDLHVLDPRRSDSVDVVERALAPGADHVLVGLSEPPESFGLEAGPLPQPSNLGLRLFADPTFARGWRAEDRTWRDLGSMPEELDGYRLAGAGCARYAGARRLYRGPGRVRYAVPITDEEVLVGLDEIDLVATATSVRPLSFPGLRTVLSVHRSRQGWWLIEDGGRRGPTRLYRTATIRSPEPEPIPAPPNPRWVGGDRGADGSPEALFLVTGTEGAERVEVHRRLESGDWRRLGESVRVLEPPVGVAPGRALLRVDRPGRVDLVSEDGVSIESTGAIGLHSLAWVPGLGAIGGTAEGDIVWRQDAGLWGRLPGTDFGWWMESLSSFREGFVGLLASGTIIQYVGRLPCSDLSVRATLATGAVVPLGSSGLILAAAIDDGAEVLYLPAHDG